MPQPSHWVVTTDWSHHGRHITTGTTEWIDVHGGKPGHEVTRSFRPDRVETVHRLSRVRANAT